MNRSMAARRANTWVVACLTLAGLLTMLTAAVTGSPSGGSGGYAQTSLVTSPGTQSIRWQ